MLTKKYESSDSPTALIAYREITVKRLIGKIAQITSFINFMIDK